MNRIKNFDRADLNNIVARIELPNNNTAATITIGLVTIGLVASQVAIAMIALS